MGQISALTLFSGDPYNETRVTRPSRQSCGRARVACRDGGIWQTRTFEGRVGQPVGVQIPLPAPNMRFAYVHQNDIATRHLAEGLRLEKKTRLSSPSSPLSYCDRPSTNADGLILQSSTTKSLKVTLDLLTAF